MQLRVLLILLTALLQVAVPVSTFGRSAGCGPDEPGTVSALHVVSDCCGNDVASEPLGKGREGLPDDNCQTCLYCKVLPNNVIEITRNVPPVGERLVGDAAVQGEIYCLGISGVPVVPPPKA